jgi:hypothetical protein
MYGRDGGLRLRVLRTGDGSMFLAARLQRGQFGAHRPELGLQRPAAHLGLLCTARLMLGTAFPTAFSLIRSSRPPSTCTVTLPRHLGQSG